MLPYVFSTMYGNSAACGTIPTTVFASPLAAVRGDAAALISFSALLPLGAAPSALSRWADTAQLGAAPGGVVAAPHARSDAMTPRAPFGAVDVCQEGANVSTAAARSLHGVPVTAVVVWRGGAGIHATLLGGGDIILFPPFDFTISFWTAQPFSLYQLAAFDGAAAVRVAAAAPSAVVACFEAFRLTSASFTQALPRLIAAPPYPLHQASLLGWVFPPVGPGSDGACDSLGVGCAPHPRRALRPARPPPPLRLAGPPIGDAPPLPPAGHPFDAMFWYLPPAGLPAPAAVARDDDARRARRRAARWREARRREARRRAARRRLRRLRRLRRALLSRLVALASTTTAAAAAADRRAAAAEARIHELEVNEQQLHIAVLTGAESRAANIARAAAAEADALKLRAFVAELVDVITAVSAPSLTSSPPSNDPVTPLSSLSASSSSVDFVVGGGAALSRRVLSERGANARTAASAAAAPQPRSLAGDENAPPHGMLFLCTWRGNALYRAAKDAPSAASTPLSRPPSPASPLLPAGSCAATPRFDRALASPCGGFFV